MPINLVHRLIYRNLVQRPKIGRSLDHFGNIINKIGIPYATGLTRNKAILFASSDPNKKQRAREALWISNRNRAQWAVYDQATGGRTALERIKHFVFDTQLKDPSNAFAVGMGISGDGGGQPEFNKALDILIKEEIINPEKLIALMQDLGLSNKQIANLFIKIKDKEDDYAPAIFNELAFILQGSYFKSMLTKLPVSPEQINTLFEKIIDKTGFLAHEAFSVLFDFLNQGLSPEQIPGIFEKIINITDNNAGFSISTFRDMLKLGYSPEQIFKLFARIMAKSELATDEAFINLSSAIKAACQYLYPIVSMEDILTIFHKIVNKAGSQSFLAFPAVKNALKIINRYLSPEQKYKLLNNMITLDWDTSIAKKEIFGLIKSILGVSKELFDVTQAFGFEKEFIFLLKDPQIPQSQIQLIYSAIRERIFNSWFLASDGRPPEDLPRVFKFCAKVMAEKALFAMDKINSIATQTKKPTITVYVLSTAYKLKIEQFTDQFREMGLSEDEIKSRIQSFNLEVANKIKSGFKSLEARMEVAREWLEKGLLTRFTLPFFIKIPSGLKPSAEVTDKLQKLSLLAKNNNWDVIFIDHSTVRTKDAFHKDDPVDFEKGRAIARAFEIMDPSETMRRWCYKINDWEIAPLSADRPNMIGLNLYDGQVYETNAGGGKPDWLPVDDRGEFIGVSWDKKGNIKRNDYLVVSRNGNNQYDIDLASRLFNRLFREAIAELRKPKEKVSINAHDILFVCNANHDRSPLAEYLMSRLLSEYVEEAESINVSSAGLEVESWLKTDSPKKEFPYLPSSGTRRLLEQRSIDYQSFKKRQIDSTMIERADFIFVMTKREKGVLLERFPQAEGKVFVMREFAGYSESDLDMHKPKTFNYQTIYNFEEALMRIIQKLSGDDIDNIRQIPKKHFRGRVYKKVA